MLDKSPNETDKIINIPDPFQVAMFVLKNLKQHSSPFRNNNQSPDLQFIGSLLYMRVKSNKETKIILSTLSRLAKSTTCLKTKNLLSMFSPKKNIKNKKIKIF